MRLDEVSLINLCTIFHPSDTLVLGVGSPLRSDDSAGLLLCDLLVERGVSCGRCEYGIENCVDVVAERKPSTLIIVDAAFFEDGKPGDIVVSTAESVNDTVRLVTTHNIPLRLVLEILRQFGSVTRVYVVGVYPKSLEIGYTISREVYLAVVKLANEFAKCLEED